MHRKSFKLMKIDSVFKNLFLNFFQKNQNALAGNRTRVGRVAGDHSTTEPPMLINKLHNVFLILVFRIFYPIRG